ncbi:Protease-associated domain containing 1 [Cichlidogyrus casuarinus]|uniref:Protease-associated domain containing 1 n=1 Tax=Cichlidogyrus casuarinus TaxID=1844966 RepID=A0ABD2QGH3_9PLAT
MRLSTVIFYILHTVLSLSWNIEESKTADYVYLRLIKPSTSGYHFKLSTSSFGPKFNTSYWAVNLVRTNPPQACSPIVNKPDILGSIAFIQRGSCSFMSKVLYAEIAGAKAVIVHDNSDSEDGLIFMSADDTSRVSHVPSAFLGAKDSQYILNLMYSINSDLAIVDFLCNVTNPDKIKLAPWNPWS